MSLPLIVTPRTHDVVTFFPNWEAGGDPYLKELGAALVEEGWRCKMAGRKGLLWALVSAVCGRGTVHLHWFEGFTPRRTWIDGIMAWLYLPVLWLAGVRGRLVWTVHNIAPHEGYAPLMGMPFLRLLAHASSRILVHFEDTRVAVESRFDCSGKVVVTPPARFGHAHGAPINRRNARANISNSLGERGELFVQVGSLRRYKQPVMTVVAFRDVAPPSAMLLIAGPCDDECTKADVVRAAGNDSRIMVRFGLLPDKDLVEALCAADWSIFPYTAIDNPGAVNLAVSYNCPVIAPALPAVRELTIGHRAILYSPDGDVRQHLADAIVSALSQIQAAPPTDAEYIPVTRRDQAAQTAAQYLAARSGRQTAGRPH